MSGVQISACFSFHPAPFSLKPDCSAVDLVQILSWQAPGSCRRRLTSFVLTDCCEAGACRMVVTDRELFSSSSVITDCAGQFTATKKKKMVLYKQGACVVLLQDRRPTFADIL